MALFTFYIDFLKVSVLVTLFLSAFIPVASIHAANNINQNPPHIKLESLDVDKILPIEISNMGMHEIKWGKVFEFQPKITGDVAVCRKDLGHDDVLVDSETGKITWDTQYLKFGRGFHIRIKCSNYLGGVYASMVVHVDKSGSSHLRIAGSKGISPYIGRAGIGMKSGDTIVFPDGLYPVSVSADRGYENAFKESAPVDGKPQQFSTLIAETPGGVIISGAAHDGVVKQKNAFQLSESNYVALVGFVVKDVQRESFTTVAPANHLILDFFGAQGAGTWGFPCGDYIEAKPGQCSNAGIRVNQGSPLIQNSYDWGHNRYGIMTRSTEGSITRRSMVRLDEHRGDQPYGGFSDYCDMAHLSQDNLVFDSLAIAAPHYKNYAGLSAYPATGCAQQKAQLKTVGLMAVNNQLSLSLMDSQKGPIHVWDNIVSYDSEGTCTPQKNRCGAWLMQAKKSTLVKNSYFGKARGFNGSMDLRRAFDDKDIQFENVIIKDIAGYSDKGTPPRYLPLSQLYFSGRSDTFYGDDGFEQATSSRRWPIPGEDIIAANMRQYFNSKALKVGGGTMQLDGNRGAVTEGNSMSEYFWAYTDPLIPPLVVRVKKLSSGNRIAWEHFVGNARKLVQGWQVVCSDNHKVVAKLEVTQLSFIHSVNQCHGYAVRAIYETGVSDIAYLEVAQ